MRSCSARSSTSAGLPGVEVQFVAQPQQELAGPLRSRRRSSSLSTPSACNCAEIGRAVADEADPADQLDVAQRAPRPLDVRLQQEDRLAVADAAPSARSCSMPAMSQRARRRTWRRNRRMKRSNSGSLPPSSRDSTSDVQIIGSPQASRQACSGVRTLWPEDQAGVEHVAQQPLGQRRHAVGRRRAVQDHQVDVADTGPRRGGRSRRGPPARSPTSSPSGPPRPGRPAPPRTGPAGPRRAGR